MPDGWPCATNICRSLHLKKLLKFLKSELFHKIIWILSVWRSNDLSLMAQSAGVDLGNPQRQVSILQCVGTPALLLTLWHGGHWPVTICHYTCPVLLVTLRLFHLFLLSSCPSRHFCTQVSDFQARQVNQDNFLVIHGAWEETQDP